MSGTPKEALDRMIAKGHIFKDADLKVFANLTETQIREIVDQMPGDVQRGLIDTFNETEAHSRAKTFYQQADSAVQAVKKVKDTIQQDSSNLVPMSRRSLNAFEDLFHKLGSVNISTGTQEMHMKLHDFEHKHEAYMSKKNGYRSLEAIIKTQSSTVAKVSK